VSGKLRIAKFTFGTRAALAGRLVLPVSRNFLITFCVSRRRREMYCGHARLYGCLSAAACTHYWTDPDVMGEWYGMPPPSCALLGGVAIAARVALLWQRANAKC